MAELRDQYLNQSYIGPTIPPKPETTQFFAKPNFQNCSPYSLLCASFRIIASLIVILGIIALILWLIYQPDNLKAYVENSKLTQFNLTQNNTLTFNLTVQLSIRNPNKRFCVKYNKIEAAAFYGGIRIGDVGVDGFYQPKKNTTVLGLGFEGGGLEIGEMGGESYRREKGEGWFYVNLKVYTRMRLRMIVVNSVVYTPEIDCSLRLPAAMNGSDRFERTECHIGQF